MKHTICILLLHFFIKNKQTKQPHKTKTKQNQKQKGS